MRTPTEAEVEAANRRLTTAVNVRVLAHRDREARTIDVPTYLTRLRWARKVEDELEPVRRAAGYRRSRAYELCTAYTAAVYRR